MSYIRASALLLSVPPTKHRNSFYFSRSTASGLSHHMSDFEDHQTNADSFSGPNDSSPLDAQLPRAPSLTYSETIDLWSHATLLYHNLEWEQALSTHRRILRQCGAAVRKGYLWFNIGAIRAILGEYYLAAEAFAKAIKHEPEFAVGWYCLGISLFELSAFRSATKAFEKCLGSFAADESVDYCGQGLDFVLERTRVEWNCRQALLEKNYKKAGALLSLDTRLGLNRMPAERLFEPPSLGNDDELEADDVAAPSPKPSSEPRPTPSSSGKLRRGMQRLLSKHPKQSAKFEHSNPRLQALEEVTSSDSEIRREAFVPILAPSALGEVNTTQQRRITFSPEQTSQGSQSKKLSSKSSTWPRSKKPPSSLPFVTATDLSRTNTEPQRSGSVAARTPNLTTPQASTTTQPSAAVVYHEGPIRSTEYIPTPTNFDTFMHTAPTALIQNPQSRHAPSPDMPAPLSIPKRPRRRRIRSTPPSPTSIYSRPSPSSPETEQKPLPAPANPSNTQPTTAATQTWLDTTFPPPRWDSLPAHLRPAPRPSRRDQRPPERQHHPFSSSHRDRSPPSVEERRPAPTLLLPSLSSPHRRRESVASMDSFAIVGLGRQAATWDEGVGWRNDGGVDVGRRGGSGAGAGAGSRRRREGRMDEDGDGDGDGHGGGDGRRIG